MTEILFYHLTESTLENALPGLVERSLERNWKVVVQTGSEERRDSLDNHLWTWSDASFLAHATDLEANPEEQPVILTTGEGNPNGATVRFLVDGAVPANAEAYDRLVLMFDGHDQSQLEQAREQWRRLKEEGHSLTYWQQNAEGRWEKKA
ncbi:DNA polymerase III subunit chi [Phyllobacterium sp. 21LDTY02-6]|uniref:DNA polymerase III subunit chi n=1 Tax=Phyllobacterium sp. 21LDTY02-6 TaxID=2944903 RepID=UPI0020212938|nr:DNA polymerase III subunit chi [Phyllobacterium sp. 21LDTY02-6]MCO4319741.1 DNA polymerase III subunit chi [Phyllobacterium sp. 21LDTY02-6]